MPTPYEQGKYAALYEERRGAGYSPSRIEGAANKLEYAEGYLSVNRNYWPAKEDVQRLKKDTAMIIDKPLVYEDDGNVLFYDESKPRRRLQS